MRKYLWVLVSSGLPGCIEDAHETPLAYHDNGLACSSDAGLPRCRPGEFFVCGRSGDDPWFERLTVDPEYGHTYVAPHPEGRLLSILAVDAITDLVENGDLTLLIRADGSAWCDHYQSPEVDSHLRGWFDVPILKQCLERPPTSRVVVEDDHVAFVLRDLSIIDGLGDQGLACVVGPTDIHLKGCAGVAGVEELLME